MVFTEQRKEGENERGKRERKTEYWLLGKRSARKDKIQRKTGNWYVISFDEEKVWRCYAKLPSSLHPDPVSCTTWFVWSSVSSGVRHTRINISSMACLRSLDSASPRSHEKCLEGLDISTLNLSNIFVMELQVAAADVVGLCKSKGPCPSQPCHSHGRLPDWLFIFIPAL